MQLTVMERFRLLEILPGQGNFATLKIVHQLKMALAPSEQELKAFGITEDPARPGLLTVERPQAVADIPIGEKATDLIVATLKKLSKEEKLSLADLSLWEKFVPGEE